MADVQDEVSARHDEATPQLPEPFNPKAPMEKFDWDGLYAQFEEEMSRLQEAEEKLFNEMGKMTAV